MSTSSPPSRGDDPRPRMSPRRRWRLVRTAVVAITVVTLVAGLVIVRGRPAADAAVSVAAVSVAATASAGTPSAAGETSLPSPTPSMPGSWTVTDAAPPLVPARDEDGRHAQAIASTRSLRRTPMPPLVRDSLTVRGWMFGRDGMLWPVPGAKTVAVTGWRVHPVYGYRSCHTGVDIQGTWGTRILAAQAGVVASIGRQGAYGIHTVIRHAGGITTMYAHQDEALVRVGQVVARGEVIGLVGSTGWVTGPHLHFEIHRHGMPFDPLGWFLPDHAERAVGCATMVGY